MIRSEKQQPQMDVLWLWLVPILMLVAWLATIRLNVDIFWSDEEFSVFMSGGAHYGPISPLLFFVRVADHAWPPLYYMLLVVWSQFLGWSDFSVRLLSLFIGLLAIPVIYRLGRDMVSSKAGLISALFLGTSAFYVHYLHEGRGYTLYVLLSAINVWMYWRLVYHQGVRDRQTKLGFLISAVGLMYTHYIAPVTLITLGLYHLLFVRKNRRWHQIFGLFFVALLLFIPWAAIMILAVVSEATISRGLDPITILVSSFHGFSNGLWTYLVLILVYGAVFVRSRAAEFSAFWLLTAITLSLIFNAATDFLFHIRHIIVLLLPLVLLMAMVVLDLARRRRWIGAAVLITWVAAGAWSYVSPEFMDSLAGQIKMIPREPVMATVETLNQCANPDDAVILYLSVTEEEGNNARVFQYYLHGQPMRFAQVHQMDDLSGLVETTGDYEARVQSMVEGMSRVWFFARADLPHIEPIDQLETLLRQEYTQCGQVIDAAGLEGYVYSNDSTLTCAASYITNPVLSDCQRNLIGMDR